MDKCNFMQMKWWGDNIKQTLQFFVLSIFNVLAYEQIFHDLGAHLVVHFCKFIGLEKGRVVENNKPSDAMVCCPAPLTLKFNILKSSNKSKKEIILPSLPPPPLSLSLKICISSITQK